MSKPLPSASRRPHGFTLIELMAVVVVIGLLAVVVLPGFLDSVRKGRRSEAMAALTQVQQAQERWRANNSAYADNTSALGVNATTYYDLALSDVTAAGYTATATAKSGTSQTSDSACNKLVLRLAGGNLFYTSVDSGGTADTTGAKRCWVR